MHITERATSVVKTTTKLLEKAAAGGFAQSLFRMFMGRCTFFACVFTAVGLYGWLVLARDLTSFALFAGSIQALLLAHSTKEDWNNQQNQQQNTTVVNDITVQK